MGLLGGLGLNSIVPGLQLVGGVLGTLDAQRKAKNAAQAYQQAIDQETLRLEEERMQGESNNARALMAATGHGADAIDEMGRRFGASLAGAGLSNSSAVGGALALAKRDTDAALSDMAVKGKAAVMERYNQGRRNLLGMRLGQAGQNMAQTQADLQGARGGLASGIGSIVQNNLLRLGVPNARTAGPVMNGNQNGAPVQPAQPSLINPSLMQMQPYQPAAPQQMTLHGWKPRLTLSSYRAN